MTTLHDRLADLATDAPSGGPVLDLWDRGRRYQRRRRVGTAVIMAAVVVLVAGVVGLDLQRSAPEPLPADGPVGLPDQVWTPSPWLPSTDRPGRLVAVSSAERRSWRGVQPSWVGISATTGTYAFLDLANAVPERADAELAPDGRHVAYWLTGPTTGTANSSSGPVTGVAILDVTSGTMTPHWIATEHGLMPDFLSWADADTLVFSAGQIRGGDDASSMDQSSGTFGTVTEWTLGGTPEAVPGVQRGAFLGGAAHGRILVSQDPSRKSGPQHLLVDLDRPDAARGVRVPQVAGSTGSLHFVALDQSGRRVALVPGSQSPHPVAAGAWGAVRRLPGPVRAFGVADWLDGDTVVTLVPHPGFLTSSFDRVSISTGASEELVRMPESSGGGWQFATDLFGAPSVAAVEPPTPMDPRLVAGTVVLIVALGLGALLSWRRRVRP